MIQLSPDERRRLREILSAMPELAEPAGRRQVLENAGLGDLAQRIDLGGTVFLATSAIISYLAQYGRHPSAPEQPAVLDLFLNEIKSLTGLDNQRYLSDLMNRHAMMTPVADVPVLDDWHRGLSPTEVEERIIGANTLRPIAFLASGLRAALPVALIEIRTSTWRSSGTGFLISPDLLITNHHVLGTPGLRTDTVVCFNYEKDEYGQPRQVREYRPRSDGLFHSDRRLDYAIVELEGRPGDDWGVLPYEGAKVAVGDRVNIIQHPGGRPKEIALQSNFVEHVGEDVVQYVTPTERGSSGSPVLTDGWQVCALHRGSVRLPSPGGQLYRNQGSLMSRIIADLPAGIRDRVTPG